MNEGTPTHAPFQLVLNSETTRKRSAMAEKDEETPLDEESRGEKQEESPPAFQKVAIETAGVTEGDSSSTSSTSPDHTQNNEGSHCDDSESSGDQLSCSSDAPVVPLFCGTSAGSTSTTASTRRRRRTVKMVDVIPLEAADDGNSVHDEINDGFHHFPSSLSSSSHSYVNFGGWVGTLPKSDRHWGDSEEDTQQKVGAAVSLSPPSPPPLSPVTEKDEYNRQAVEENYEEEEDRKMPATVARKSIDNYDVDVETDNFEDEYFDTKRKKRQKGCPTVNENDAPGSVRKCAPDSCAAPQASQNPDEKCGAIRSKEDGTNGRDNADKDEDLKKQYKTMMQKSTVSERAINRTSQSRSYDLLTKYIASTGIDMDVAAAMAAKFASDEKDTGESKREIDVVERGDGRSYKDEYRRIYSQSAAQNNDDTYDRDLALKRPARRVEEAPNSPTRSIASSNGPRGEMDVDDPAPSLDAEESANNERRSSAPEARPGAVFVSGRAAGQFPVWGRSNLTQPLQRPSTDSISIANAASVAAQDDSVADEISLVEANLVTDDDDKSDIVLVTAESMPHPLKLMWRDKRWRILLMILILISGIAIAIVFGAVVQFNSGDDEAVQEVQPTVQPTASPTTRPTVNHDAIKEIFIPLSGEAALDEIGSPQRSAMVWLANYDETGEDLGGMFFQRYAMTVFYFATTMGDSTEWRVKDSWLDPTKHECDWGIGITCTKDILGRNVVVSINLEDNGLSGIFPTELRLLEGLETLQLNNNALRGEIPETIGQMTKLRFLDLGNNKLTGSVPDSIRNCSELHTLSLHQNQFNGGFDWLYELKELRVVNLADNKFKTQMSKRISELTRLTTMKMERNLISGEVPGEAFAIPDMAYLHLDGNQLNGSLPSLSTFFARRVEITLSNNQITGTLPDVEATTTDLSAFEQIDFFRIQKIDISNNKLRGALPPFLYPSIMHLHFSHNEFTGTIPISYALAEGLSHIDLSHNMLNGTLPSRIGNPQNIKHIKLQGNQLNGTIPKEYGGFQSLEMLKLHQNTLSGEIPVELLSLEKLIFLDLRECGLSGRIPDAVGNWKELVLLDLGENELTGSIPDEIGQLAQLKTMRLDFNSIEGTVPSSLGNLKELKELVLDGNDIKGILPQEICDLNLDRLYVDCEVDCQCCTECTEPGKGPSYEPLKHDPFD